MNAKVKKLWIDALRSGKYEQGKFRLRQGDKFCCLGVLCDLADPALWVKGENDEYGYPDPGESFLHTSFLPGFIFDWLGIQPPARLSRAVPKQRGLSDCLTNLAHANDEGKTFVEIAEMIEKL